MEYKLPKQSKTLARQIAKLELPYFVRVAWLDAPPFVVILTDVDVKENYVKFLVKEEDGRITDGGSDLDQIIQIICPVVFPK